MLPDCFFYSVITSLNKSLFFVELLFTVTAYFIQSFSGSVSLSRPNSSKKSIAKLNIRRNDFSVINLIIGHHTVAGTVMFYGIFFKETVALDVLKLAGKLTRIMAGLSVMFKLMDKCQLNITPPHLQHSHGENLPHLSWLPSTADRVTRLGEVTHLSSESSQEKKRDCMEKLVTSPRRGTSPTWGPPPPCDQALSPNIKKMQIMQCSHPTFI